MSRKEFRGIIKLDIRDSKPDGGRSTPAKAPAGAPNIPEKKEHGGKVN